MRSAIVALGVLAASLIGGCVVGPAGPPATDTAIPFPPGISVSNGTTIPVTIVVNGTAVSTIPPSVREDPMPATLPPPPWTIETRSPSGRLLSSLTVSATDLTTSETGRAVRVDLSCGRLDVWVGPPVLGGTFVPGPPGDCD
jgi:hypothetical protein